MQMHNPMHPGEFIKESYLIPLGIKQSRLAKYLKVSPKTVSRIIKGQASISAEMALKLSVVLGRSPESWLNLQNYYDLWLVKKAIDLREYECLYTSSNPEPIPRSIKITKISNL